MARISTKSFPLKVGRCAGVTRKFISVEVNPEEAQTIKNAAAAHGLTVREFALNALIAYGVPLSRAQNE